MGADNVPLWSLPLTPPSINREDSLFRKPALREDPQLLPAGGFLPTKTKTE